MKYKELKQRVVKLRKDGLTFPEIQKELDVRIPKSTLSCWCHNLKLSTTAQTKLQKKKKETFDKTRMSAVAANKKKRVEYLGGFITNNKHLISLLENQDVAKLALALLQVAEGTKRTDTLVFGNSDPGIIQLYLRLLHDCFRIDKNKFRCTIQCRDGQDSPALKKFWSRTTKIPLNQFYKTRIDPRSKGKLTTKPEYKGVCKIDYFSGKTAAELFMIGKLLTGR